MWVLSARLRPDHTSFLLCEVDLIGLLSFCCQFCLDASVDLLHLFELVLYILRAGCKVFKLFLRLSGGLVPSLKECRAPCEGLLSSRHLLDFSFKCLHLCVNGLYHIDFCFSDVYFLDYKLKRLVCLYIISWCIRSS